MAHARWFAGTTLLTIWACAGGSEVEPPAGSEVATATETLMNTSPRGTVWVTTPNYSGVGVGQGAVEIVFDAQYAYWLGRGDVTGTQTAPAHITRAPLAGGGPKQTIAELPGELGRDLAIRGGTLYFGTDQRIGAVE